MRFKLSAIFFAISLVAAMCCLLFVAPLAITAVVVLFILLISPAVWLTGAIYARGGRQAFFIGGTLTGFVPYVISTYYFGMIAFQYGGEAFSRGLTGQGMQLGVSDAKELLITRIFLALIWIASGIFACAGGGVATLTHRLLCGRPAPTPINTLEPYRVIEGRLRTTIVDPVAEAER